jgi:hypothetical protein
LRIGQAAWRPGGLAYLRFGLTCLLKMSGSGIEKSLFIFHGMNLLLSIIDAV